MIIFGKVFCILKINDWKIFHYLKTAVAKAFIVENVNVYIRLEVRGLCLTIYDVYNVVKALNELHGLGDQIK